MKKLVLFPFLIAFACGLAALYGALHNQISYTVAPEYFLDFKFHQFNIPPALPDRLGAALVGILASWWMGLVSGLPIALISAFAPGAGRMAAIFVRTAFFIMAITLALGLATLLVPQTLLAQVLDQIPIPVGVSDTLAFARAGLMHDTSYLAGGLGMLVGLGTSLRAVLRDTRKLVAPEAAR